MAKSGQFELAQKEGKRNVNTKTFKKKAVCVWNCGKLMKEVVGLTKHSFETSKKKSFPVSQYQKKRKKNTSLHTNAKIKCVTKKLSWVQPTAKLLNRDSSRSQRGNCATSLHILFQRFKSRQSVDKL
jgi:hypothetical protein